ncbi:MAG: hypothetical protein HFF52_00965 [Lawsonibacter sp.]|nr:hypothetical protein [Lawsonibacter sp.]
MSGMSISGVGTGAYYQTQTTSSQAAVSGQEGERLAQALREQEESQPDLVEMMKQAREKAAEREKLFKLPKNSQRYGDAAMMAYAKLARARSLGEVDAASGYARRRMAQLRMAKRSDSDNADRIQAAINQLQKAVNRAGRKKREISQERLTAKRQAKLEKEKRTREAKRLRHQLKSRQTMRVIRESGYLREAEIDNRFQDQLAASKLEMRNQMQELLDKTQPSVDAAVQQYTAAAAPAAEPAAEINIQV